MKTHIQNPFQYGTIVQGEAFCNRKEEIKQLKTFIDDSYSVWLYSPRRYGKSSLVHKVFAETREVKTIYFDLYNVKSLDDFCRKYAALLAANLFSWKQELKKLAVKFSQYFQNLNPVVNIDQNGIPTFTLSVEKIKEQLDVEVILNIPLKISEDTGTPICIAFDEFQEIERIEPFLINWMRSAFQYHRNISYLFLGSQQSLMESIFTTQTSPFYEFATKMTLEPIQPGDWKKFITDKFGQHNLEVTRDTVDDLLRISGGHPHFTQYFASVVFDLVRNGVNQQEEGFSQLWLDQIIRSQSVIFQNIYDQLTNTQRAVLQTVALLQAGEEVFSGDVREKYRLPTGSSLASAMSSLQKKGLIRKNQKKYAIVNPVMKYWLRHLS
jgi:AAA+ ATPase superfamily predicted ATPase